MMSNFDKFFTIPKFGTVTTSYNIKFNNMPFEEEVESAFNKALLTYSKVETATDMPKVTNKTENSFVLESTPLFSYYFGYEMGKIRKK